MSENNPANENVHEDDMPEKIGACEFCMKTLREGDAHLRAVDGCLSCEDCAPTYQDVLNDPGTIWEDEEPLTEQAARRFVNLHLANGGKLTDKVVNS